MKLWFAGASLHAFSTSALTAWPKEGEVLKAYNQPMRTWSLGPEDPRLLRLAADALAGPTDYVNDHIWELKLTGGRPPAVGVETTYGRRARAFRLFPGFTSDGPTVTDPGQFEGPPRIRSFLPSWRRVDYSPLAAIDVEAEYWVPHSHALAGRFRLINRTSHFQPVRLSLFGVLDAVDGRSLQWETRAGAAILAGKSGGLIPVAFLAGGAAHAAGPVPGLELTLDLAPHAARPVVWCCAAEPSLEASFSLARDTAGRAWDAEIARLERLHAGWVEIETGNGDWDAALALSQLATMTSFVGPANARGAASLVATRTPDDGHSPAGDGSDYDDRWSGLDIETTSYVARQIIHAVPEMAKSLLEQFLSAQEANGAIDGKPGPAGQRGKWLCAPRLAGLAFDIFQHTGDRELLREAFPQVLRFFNHWVSETSGSSEGAPRSWDHPRQAKIDGRPALSVGTAAGEAADMRYVFFPDLAACLAHEARTLLKISEVLQEDWARADLEHRLRDTEVAAAGAWSPKTSTYHYLDRETRQATPGRAIGAGEGPVDLSPSQDLDPPGRIQVRLALPEVRARRVRVVLEGRGANGRHRREQLGAKDFRWLWDQGMADSAGTFLRLDRVRVEGIEPDVPVEVRCPNLRRQDLRLLLPMWAGLADEGAVRSIVRHTLEAPDRYGRPGGWPMIPADDPAYAPDAPGGPWTVDLAMQEMLGCALVADGYRAEAAQHLTRLMESIAAALKTDGDFAEAYHPERPAGWGRRGHVGGVAPLSYFLAVAGVRLLASGAVELEGRHVFPWPVTIRWKGLNVVRSEDGTRVTFPDGQEVFVDPGKEGVVERAPED